MTVREAKKIVELHKHQEMAIERDLDFTPFAEGKYEYLRAKHLVECNELYKPLVEALTEIASTNPSLADCRHDAKRVLAHYRTHILGEEK